MELPKLSHLNSHRDFLTAEIFATLAWLSLVLNICPNVCVEIRPNQQYFSCFNYTECMLDAIPAFPMYLLQCKQGQQAGCCYPSKNKFLFAANMAEFHRNPNQFSGTEVMNSNLIFPLKLKPSKIQLIPAHLIHFSLTVRKLLQALL